MHGQRSPDTQGRNAARREAAAAKCTSLSTWALQQVGGDRGTPSVMPTRRLFMTLAVRRPAAVLGLIKRGSKEGFRTNQEPQPKSAFADLSNVVDEQENADGSLTSTPEDAERHFGFVAWRTPEQQKHR